MEILVGFVADYDAQEGRARMRVRSRLLPGDLIHIAGVRTDKEVRLKALRIGEDLSPDGQDGEIEVVVPGIETGDMVFRVVGTRAGRERAVA